MHNMKKSHLRNIIKEEIRNVLTEEVDENRLKDEFSRITGIEHIGGYGFNELRSKAYYYENGEGSFMVIAAEHEHGPWVKFYIDFRGVDVGDFVEGKWSGYVEGASGNSGTAGCSGTWNKEFTPRVAGDDFNELTTEEIFQMMKNEETTIKAILQKAKDFYSKRGQAEVDFYRDRGQTSGTVD